MRSLRSTNFFTALALITTLVLAGCGGNGADNTQEATAQNSNGNTSGVAIKVGSESLSQAEFDQRLNQQMQRMKQLERFRNRFKQQLANQLTTKLTLQHFVSQENITVSDSEVNGRFQQIEQQFPSRQAMQKALKKQGVTIQSLKDRIRQQLSIQKLIEQRIGTIDVSSEEAQQYYQKNQQEFSQPEKVKARHILIKDDTGAKQQINSIKERLNQGASFEELATKESEGPSSKRGGDLGFITRDRMVKPFSDAAFNLGVGEISDPVKTRYGWHIIKVEDRKQATQPKFENIEDTIVQQVKNQKRQQSTQKLIQKLKSQVEIVNNVISDTATMRSRPSPQPGQ
jgi:parvulin-like peptidyl-prolyl isomerase